MVDSNLAARETALSFTVWGIAQPKGSTRAFVPQGWTRAVVTAANPKTKGWQELVAEAALGAMPSPTLIDGPVSLSVSFYLPRPKSIKARTVPHTTKPDLDKLVRAVKDGLTRIVWRDDAQVVEVKAWKQYAPPTMTPHALITVEPAR